MVLKYNDENITIQKKSLAEVYTKYPGIVNHAEEFKELETLNLGEVNSLYVGQGEYAVIPGNEELPHTVGSDDATTCHIAIFHHSLTNTCAVVHLDDRAGQDKSLIHILQQIKDLDGCLGFIDVYAIGGYSTCNSHEALIGSKNCSEEISLKLLYFLIDSSITFNIKLLCTCNLNTEKHVDKPILTGLAINRQTGKVYPANFSVRCPAPVLRSAFFWVEGSENLLNIYDSELQAVVVRPFHNWEQEQFAYLSTLSDSRLLANFSTSPLVESPTFCVRLRETFLFLSNNTSIFKKGCKKYFKLKCNGQWEELILQNDNA